MITRNGRLFGLLARSEQWSVVTMTDTTDHSANLVASFSTDLATAKIKELIARRVPAVKSLGLSAKVLPCTVVLF